MDSAFSFQILGQFQFNLRGAFHLRRGVSRGNLGVASKSGSYGAKLSNFPAALLHYASNTYLKGWHLQSRRLMSLKGAS